MHARIFSSAILKKSTLETSIEWHHQISDTLKQQITAIHLAAFLDLYRPYTETQLGLKPGMTKRAWLSKMIQDELEEVQLGRLFLATISVNDKPAGFIVCNPVKARHEDLKNDTYISLLAVKPFYEFHSQHKIRIGLGKQLVENLYHRFHDANTFTLDTRLINQPAMAFYESLGFANTGRHTFGGSNPDYYAGYEKSVMRRI